MGDKKILSFASLGLALVAVISAAEGSALKTELEAFKADFDALGKQVDNETQSNFKQSNQVISELKVELEKALDVKQAASTELTVTVDKVKYVINHGSYPHSREEIANSPEIAKAILKIVGQNAISKL